MIQKQNDEIQYIKISKLTLLEKNPRRISKEQMEKLEKSLTEDPDFLKYRPILVNKVGDKLEVYAGNQRVRATKKLKWKEVPCIIENELDSKIMRARTIKDNKTYGEFDLDMIANEWDTQELLDAGFQDYEIPNIELIEDEMSEDEEDNKTLSPGEDKDAKTKLGDVYELISGEITHRIGCGDSTDPDHVAKILNGEEPILMVTDPPYGVEYDPGWRGRAGKGIKATGKVQNDDKVNWALAWHLFPGSVAYVWHADKFCSEVQKSLEDAEFEIISQIIWNKQNFAISRGDYHWKHEPCWYANRKGHKHNWQGSRKETTVWEIANLGCFGKSKDEDDRTAHSTQKPIECMSRPIINNTEKGQGVYDPFLGSGTTLIACEQNNRVCYAGELSPAYCDISIQRWVNLMKKNNKEFIIKKNNKIEEW